MSVSLDPRHQALASYTILAIVVSTLVFAAFATPIRERAAFFVNNESQRMTYAKSLEALARSAVVSAQFELRHAANDAMAQTFHADTPALAGANLQDQLNSLVAAEGGTLLSSAFRESPPDGAVTPIAVTVRLRCSTDALLRILHGLENRTPVLFVEALSVQGRGQGSQQRQTDGDLDVELDVVGLLDTRALP
jgi:general secretion pathway protein M